MRTVKTASGATAVQIVRSSRRGSRNIEHLGSAHDEQEVEALRAAARQRLAGGQLELGLGLQVPAPGGPLPITSSRMGHLVDALEHAYRVLGLEDAAGRDEVFRHLVLARIIEPASKMGSLRVLEEAGVATVSYPTLNRRLAAYAQPQWRQQLSAACSAHAKLGPASLVLYDVSTLYFETDQGDGFREPGFAKERRLEPQVTIGLLTGQDGFPLMVSAFEGNKAETKTMLPVIQAFMAAHRLPDVTVVADAGMISEASQKAIEAAGLSFTLGLKIPDVPYQVVQWRREHPGEEVPDGHVFTQPWPAGPKDKRRDQVIYYHYKAGRARRALRGIDEQVTKAAKAVAGLAPVKRNRVHQARRHRQERQPGTRGQGPPSGRAERLRHQPRGLPRRHSHHPGVRDRLLRPALRDREKLPHVQARPAGQTRPPPQTRLHRSPPDHRVRGAGRQPLDRAPDGLVDQEVRQDHPPLQDDPDPGRAAYPHRRRPAPTRPAPRPRPHQATRRCALI